ncbi:hypothetical protein MASR2M29_09530 [Spirochaetota bacterium]
MYTALMNTEEFRKAISKIDTIIIPVGSHEAHGMHCPLGTDNLIPERLCADLEGQMADEVLTMPPVNYGYTPLLAAFSGTVCLKAETLVSLYSEIGCALAAWGAKNIIFMNGHGGNIAMLSIACDRIAEAGATAAAISWWATYSNEILKICSTQGHAGEDETSLVLAIDTSLVDPKGTKKHMKKGFVAPLAGPGLLKARFPDAMNGDAGLASKEKGQELFRMMLEKNMDFVMRIKKGQFTDDI